MSFNTQPPEGGCIKQHCRIDSDDVSTHSRPKAAAPQTEIESFYRQEFQHTAARRRLLLRYSFHFYSKRFQHTAARRRLPMLATGLTAQARVSTHSRPKAAAPFFCEFSLLLKVSTHSRPKAAAY